MESITIRIERKDVFDEVEKATDYTGSKLLEGDSGARDRIMAGESDLTTMERFWTDAAHGVNERFKDMVETSTVDSMHYEGVFNVSVAFDRVHTPSIEKCLRSYFIDFIIGEWFKFAKKDESEQYFAEAGEYLTNAERLFYSRKRPTRPTD